MKLRHAAAGFAGRQMLNALFATTSFKVMTDEPDRAFVDTGKPVIYVIWHGRLLPLAYHHRHQQLTCMISRSGDGEYLARTIDGWGFDAARGSSSRGGSSALREMVKVARSGRGLVLTADGPRGPRQKLKGGVITAAQLTGLPIIAATAASTGAWWFEGWDRFLLPKPWSKIYVRYAGPWLVDRDADEADLARVQSQVETTLNDMTAQADADAQS